MTLIRDMSDTSHCVLKAQRVLGAQRGVEIVLDQIVSASGGLGELLVLVLMALEGVVVAFPSGSLGGACGES